MAKSYTYELWRYDYVQVDGKWEQKWALFHVYDNMKDTCLMMDKLDEEENEDHPLERETVSFLRL